MEDRFPSFQADLFRDPYRTGIVGIDVGNDFREIEGNERMPEQRFGRLASQTLPPCVPTQSPADLDLRSKCVDRAEQHPPDERRPSVAAAAEAPIAQSFGLGAARSRLNEGPMCCRIRPGTMDETRHVRLAIRRQAGIRIGQHARPDQQPRGLERRLHPFSAILGRAKAPFVQIV
jgi:hypothetical protein